MALTISNPNAITLINILNRTSSAQSDALTRMSTGSRINKASDDPAGLIALRSVDTEITAVAAALSNNQRTDAMLGVADSAMSEIASMLNDIQDLAQKSTNSAGLSASELAANQAQIDNAITAIDRIVATTQFNGKNLIDGALALNTSTTNGSSRVTDINVFSRGSSTGSKTLTVELDSVASQAGTSATTSTYNGAVTLSIQGTLGTAIIEVASGATISAVAQLINDAAAQTGVSAASAAGATLMVYSQDYGANAFARVEVLSGGGSTYTGGYDAGVDAGVRVDGQAAATDGLEVSYSRGGYDLTFNLNSAWATAGQTETITIAADGGATFQLGTDSTTVQTLGLSGLQSNRLGSVNDGYLSSLKSGGGNSLFDNPGNAAQIAAAASNMLSMAQGRIGGFQKFQVQTSINALEATNAGLQQARSTIADVDYATESAELNKQNVLMQSAMSLLGLANQQSTQILNLL